MLSIFKMRIYSGVKLSVIMIVAAILAVTGCGGSSPASWIELQTWQDELFEKINTERRLGEVPSLDRYKVLDRVAAEIAYLAINEQLEGLKIKELLAENGISAYIIAGHMISSFSKRDDNMSHKALNELKLTDPKFLMNNNFRSAGVSIRYADGFYYVVFVGAHIVESDDKGNYKPIVTEKLWAVSEVKKYEIEHYDLLNKVRVKNGLSELEYDDQLSALARVYANKMLKEGFFGHDDPFGKGFIQRVDETSLNKYRVWGENLASLLNTQNPPGDAMTKLMDSPGHKANILRNGFTNVGIGVATDGRWWMFVQAFGTLR